MKIISQSYGKYECPYCHTVVELEQSDIRRWNEVYYYRCPTCGKTPHIRHTAFDNWLCPYNIQGKKAIRVN